MAWSFDALIKRTDGLTMNRLADSDHIIYRPAGNKPSRCVRGIVERTSPFVDHNGVYRKRVRITFLNDCTLGIDPHTFNVDGDRFDVALNSGNSTRTTMTGHIPDDLPEWHNAGGVTIDLY
jgi:hypothetical protein